MEKEKFTDVELVFDDNVGRVIINRPEKLNAIRTKTYRELIAAFNMCDENRNCHVILLEGSGGKFTAGNDLADLVGGDPDEVMDCVQSIFETVANLKKVMVARVEGVAVGIGTTILLHCDIVVASNTTQFRLPFTNLGVCPEGGASGLLALAIGEKAARELLLTGRFFTAQEAMQWGLVSAISEPERLDDVVNQYISTLLKQPLASLIATKRLIGISRPNVQQIVRAELQQFSQLLQSTETQSRIASLLKK